MVKRKKIKGGADVPTLTKQEVLADPKIKEALKQFVQSGAGMKIRQKGSGSWWSSFVSWLKDNKIISTVSKIGSAIATATGFVPLGVALGAAATGSSALGYGKMNGGMFYSSEDAQAIARGIAGRPAMRISRPRKMMGGQYAQSVAMPSPSSATPYLKF